MWGIVENLGLKEGFAEFTEQFNKDAKTTIANTQFAKDRGIDVSVLDDMEHSLEQKGEWLKKETIGKAADKVGGAVSAIAKDETVAKLLFDGAGEGGQGNAGPEQWPPSREVADAAFQTWIVRQLTEIYSEHNPGKLGEIEQFLTKYRGREILLYEKVCQKYGVAPQAPPEAVAVEAKESPLLASAAPAAAPAPSRAASAAAAAPAGGAAAPPHSAAAAGPLPGGAGGASGSRAAAADPVERLGELEAQVAELTAARAALQGRLQSQEAQARELEARCAEVSAVSEDAARRAEEHAQQVAVLRCTVAEKDGYIAALQDECESLDARCCAVQRECQDLEASLPERMQAEVARKEQELLDEAASLYAKSKDQDRRLEELTARKSRLERQRAPVARGQSTASSLAPHRALARAFGDLGDPQPWARKLDDPLLQVSAALLRTPVLRRAFFVLSLLAWLCALLSALKPGGTETIRS